MKKNPFPTSKLIRAALLALLCCFFFATEIKAEIPSASSPYSIGIVIPDQTSSGQAYTDTSSQNAPSTYGFIRNHRCHDEYISVQNIETAQTCLSSCQNNSLAKGCWWLDGTDGNPRECRVCINDRPQEDIYSSDWGLDLATLSTPQEDPAKLGFRQRYRCIGSTETLEESQTVSTCLSACLDIPLIRGCWWQDGTNGTRPRCRICPTETPHEGVETSDWAFSLTEKTLDQPDPSIHGFTRFTNCPAASLSLGDTQTPEACLTVCRGVSSAVGCWWRDGTGGFPRECRACTHDGPSASRFGNDWALPLP